MRFPHLLPAVARMAMGRWGELSGLLNKALNKVPAERLQGGPGGGSPTKAAMKTAKAALEDELEAAKARADFPLRSAPTPPSRHQRETCVKMGATDFSVSL